MGIKMCDEQSGSAELALGYAALLLGDAGIECTEDKLTAVLKASGCGVDPFAAKVWGSTLKGQTPLSCIRKGQDVEEATAGDAAPEADAGKDDDKDDEES